MAAHPRAVRGTRAGRLFGLGPDEILPVSVAVCTSFIASTGLMIGGSGIEALFFARFGVEELPVMYLILGGTMFLASLGIGALLARMGRGRACIVIPPALAALAVAGRIGLGADISWIYPALWLLQGVAQFLVGLSVWGLAGIVTDTRQAKRFFPLIGAGGVLGLVIGGVVTKPLASALGTANLVLVWAATLLAVGVLGGKLVAIGGRDELRPRRDRSADPVEQLRRGFRYVRRSALMRWMALASILFSLLFFSLYLPFSRAATDRFPDPEDLAGFFGLFFGLSTGVAFLLSLFVTSRLLARFGVPTVMLVLPLLYVVAFGVLAVDAGFAALLIFRFAQVAWLQGGAVSSWEAVINTVPPDRRDQTRAFLYGGPTQVGTVLAGVIALVGRDALSATALYAIGLVSAVLATVAMVGVRRAYPRELVRALREGRPNVFDAPPGGADPFGRARADSSAIGVAVSALADPDPRVRRVAAHVLGDLEPSDATRPLLGALRDEDADVRATAIRSLARSGATADRPEVLPRLSDAEASVRLAALEAVEALRPEGSAQAVRPLLRDPDPFVRARAAALLVRCAGDPDAQALLAELARGVDADVRAAAFRAARGSRGAFDLVRPGIHDPAAAARAEAARTLATVDPERALEVLVAAMADEDPLVRDAVAEGLAVIGVAAVEPVVRSLADPARRQGALAALERLPLDGRAEDVRRFAVEAVSRAVEDNRLATAIAGDEDERLRLLEDSLRLRSEREAVNGLRAAALLRGRTAMSTALESISVTEPAQRANAIEVIESVADRDIVHPLLTMWDGAPTRTSTESVLDRLRRDPDGWIRACAELAATPREGASMTPTLTTLSAMERILFLRKVPLFAELPPPDLEPIASIAEEDTFSDGDTIAEQGEVGDAMHIIVSGEVSVVVRDDAEHVLAVRSSGDVVGEMAVITNEPRMAGLVANGTVRVLSIGRRQFESILRERPETSLGVIRVLCRRLAERPA